MDYHPNHFFQAIGFLFFSFFFIFFQFLVPYVRLSSHFLQLLNACKIYVVNIPSRIVSYRITILDCETKRNLLRMTTAGGKQLLRKAKKHGMQLQ